MCSQNSESTLVKYLKSISSSKIHMISPFLLCVFKILLSIVLEIVISFICPSLRKESEAKLRQSTFNPISLASLNKTIFALTSLAISINCFVGYSILHSNMIDLFMPSKSERVVNSLSPNFSSDTIKPKTTRLLKLLHFCLNRTFTASCGKLPVMLSSESSVYRFARSKNCDLISESINPSYFE